MQRALWAALITLALVSTYSCAVFVVGAGAGAGAVSYVKGELVRSYPVDYSKAVSIVGAVAKDLQIAIDSKTDDGINAIFKGFRAGDTPVVIRVTMLDRKITQIGVRVGSVGVWDREISDAIHSHIAQRI